MSHRLDLTKATKCDTLVYTSGARGQGVNMKTLITKTKQKHTTIEHNGEPFGLWIQATAELTEKEGSFSYCVNYWFTWDKTELNNRRTQFAILSRKYDTQDSAEKELKYHFSLAHLKGCARWNLPEKLESK